MALTQSLTTSFRTELLQATHDFTNSTGDTFKMALFRATASLSGAFGAGTTNYSDMGADEVSGTNYTAGGVTLTAVTPTSSGTVAYVDFADATFSNVTLTASGALIYNSSKSDKAVAVLDFGGDRSRTAADLVVVFPAADASTAIIRLVEPS